MVITDAKYMERKGTNFCVKATIDGELMHIPLDAGNRHYAEILKQVADSTITIADSDVWTDE
jgi:hypothetical protein